MRMPIAAAMGSSTRYTSRAPALRAALLAASLSAEQEQTALVEIESTLESVVREVLEGRRPDAPAALTALRSRLGL